MNEQQIKMFETPRWDTVQGEPTPLTPGTEVAIFPVPGDPGGFAALVLGFIPSVESVGSVVLLGLPNRVAAAIGLTTLPVPVSALGWHNNEWHFHVQYGNNDGPSDVGDINWKVK